MVARSGADADQRGGEAPEVAEGFALVVGGAAGERFAAADAAQRSGGGDHGAEQPATQDVAEDIGVAT